MGISYGKTCRIVALSIALAAFMAGCSRQERVDSPEFGPYWDEQDGNAPAPQREIRSYPMTSAEKKAFERKSELDKKLDPWMEQEVKRVFLKYARDRKSTIQVFMRNSTPYLANSKAVFRRMGLPEDLAYLAFLESGYNPLAVSRSRAVGMWQFISSTGRNYGLRQDWWVDERMDPQKSTEAAAAYLSRLYEIFDDWHLAIASYNAGEGKIGRAKDASGARRLEDIIRHNERLSYDLRLREETRLYVPRFLAIAKVVRGADELGLKPAPNDSRHPALMPAVGLTAKPATDLVEFCRRLGMTWREFLSYNPQFLRSISPANRSTTVYVPRNRESQARKLLAGTVSGAGWTYYTVRRKDTPAKISRTTGVPASIIAELNPGAMGAGRRIRLPSRAGSVSPSMPRNPAQETMVAAADDMDNVTAALAELEQDILQKRSRHPRLSAPSRPSPPSRPETHTVRRGETPAGIAARYGMTLASLHAANGGAAKLKNLHAGQVLRLTPPAGTQPASPQSAKAATHTVQAGETLTGIARKHGISLNDLYAANGGADRLKNIQPGQKINLYAPVAAAQTAPSRAQAPAARTPSPAAAPAALPGASRPAVHTVQAGESLTGIARKYGISLNDIYAANGGAAKLKNIQPGQKVKLPPAGGAVRPATAVQQHVQPKAPARQAQAPQRATGAPSPAQAKPAGGFHVVQPGETLWSIARKYDVHPGALLKLNGMDVNTKVRTGEKIKIPGSR